MTMLGSVALHRWRLSPTQEPPPQCQRNLIRGKLYCRVKLRNRTILGPTCVNTPEQNHPFNHTSRTKFCPTRCGVFVAEEPQQKNRTVDCSTVRLLMRYSKWEGWSTNVNIVDKIRIAILISASLIALIYARNRTQSSPSPINTATAIAK